MSKYCPIVDHRVTYQFCQECENKICFAKPDKKTQKEKIDVKKGNN